MKFLEPAILNGFFTSSLIVFTCMKMPKKPGCISFSRFGKNKVSLDVEWVLSNQADSCALMAASIPCIQR